MEKKEFLFYYDIKNYQFETKTIKTLSDRTTTIERAVGIILQSSFYKMKQNLYKNYHGVGSYSSASLKIFRNEKKRDFPAPLYKIGRFISKKEINFQRYKIFWLWFPTYDLESIIRGGEYPTTSKQKKFLQKRYKIFMNTRRYKDNRKEMFEKIFISFDVNSVKNLIYYEIRNMVIKENFLMFRYFEKNRNPRICRLKRTLLRWN